MSAFAPPVHGEPAARARLLVRTPSVRRAILWTFVFCGATAAIEPSPYEFMFVVAALAFLPDGLAFDRAIAPLVVLLAAFNAGGLIALPPYVGDSKSVTFVFISIYMAMTALLFAGLIAKAPLERLQTIKSGYIAAGAFAAALGVIGYFNIGGLGEHLTLYNRASGPFKDPNVFGTFLVPPIVWIARDLIVGRSRGFLRSLALLMLMLLGVLLSFSRGAWGVAAASLALTIALDFFTTRSAALRQRIVALSILGVVLVVVLLTIALSVPAIRDVFLIRASLSQDYDLGELGRFGSQMRSLPMLLERPFGFGPLQYRNHFPEDPHEVYVNAFASYGWLGGLAFAALTTTTLYVGWRLVFTRSFVQSAAIPVWSCLFVQMAQGFQIDTDHWRHLYLLLGALYGLAAAERRARIGADAQRRAIV